MAYNYNQQRSEIFEMTMLPVLSYSRDESEWDFTQKELSILAKDLDTLEEIYQLFLPYQEKLRSYYLMGAGWSFLTTCYFYLLNEGKEPSSIEELHELVLNLSEEELHYCLRLFLTDDTTSQIKNKDYWEILEEKSFKPEEKWHILTFSHNLKDNTIKMVELSRELVNLYAPYFEKARAERETYAKNLNLEAVFKDTQALKMIQGTLQKESFELYIVSPWIIRLSVITLGPLFEKYNSFLILSCKIDEVLNSHNELDEDNFSSALKTLSDLTRYKVLVALTQPHAKSKDIAEDLGITSAAVSFHRQKLQNAQLLLFNSSEKHTKYDPNTELIQAVVDKLKDDFNLK